MKERRARIRTEALDLVQYFFGEFKYNDHQIHCVLDLEGRVDAERMKRAVLRSMEVAPVMGSRFVPHKRHPYWEPIDAASWESAFAIAETSDRESEIAGFLTSRTDESAGPQIKVTVVRDSRADTLCAVVNHMVCDAAGFKQYLYLLSDLYQDDAACSHIALSASRRNLGQIYQQFSLLRRARVFFLPHNSSKSQFTLAEKGAQRLSAPPESFVSRFTLSSDRFGHLKEYAAAKNVTVNDVVLTAYFRAAHQLLHTGYVRMTIPCTVDLRRYLPRDKPPGLCNLSSWIPVEIVSSQDESFDDLLSKVHRVMESKKHHYPGLDGFGMLASLFSLLPFSLVKRIIGDALRPSLMTMTNLGIIEKDRLTFGCRTTAGYITASNKYPPYFQLCFSTFDDVVTFSINLPDFASNRENVRRFWEAVTQELNRALV